MEIRFRRWFTACLLVSFMLLSSCAGQNQTQENTSSASPTPAETVTPAPTATNSLSPQFSKLPRLNGEATVEMVVKGSPITIRIDGANAPITAGNFVDLVNRQVYDGTAFHRVVREPQPFVVQGGDPQSKDPAFPVNRLGTGGYIDPATNQERAIPLEIKPAGADQPVYSKTFETAGITAKPALAHTRGAVAMARSALPDSASAQFYVALDDLTFLDGNYAVFGYVTSGMEVVDQIQQGDRITSAKVTAGLENLQAAN
ncbi:peptidylprolyl isomerase [Leptolyngbya ohadii]|uniref:peptidylprolyl isomerase n=1 Tax=Leptolyngbya ohadii TaxID=1962290 RepID=UPI000B59E891|nr:peptidylprolyl isomerase [Leptolyngbya ohadii]